jgi:hypothetical protein
MPELEIFSRIEAILLGSTKSLPMVEKLADTSPSGLG